MESAYEGKVEKLLLIACRQAAGETSGIRRRSPVFCQVSSGVVKIVYFQKGF
jgi:hypothetical protein